VLLLAIDTSGTGVTVAVHDRDQLLALRSDPQPRRHAELLAPTVREAMAEAGVGPGALTGVAVGIGPGPFTGLRAGVVTARVLALTWQLPVHGVCSLDALAQQALDAGGVDLGEQFLVATDARRAEVYWAAYQVQDAGAGAGTLRVAGPEVAAPDQVPGAGRRVLGRGAALYPEALGPGGPVLDVTGAGVARLAVRRLLAGGPDDGPEPLYLRRPDASPPGARKRVLQ
jgi:tRNA threonylcarbamoyladenosine biosynthesis protein TsaB